jgi:3-oxoacyl-[acyl-carrier-protein] synthase-3
MLSDSVGAAILEERPNLKGFSLKVEWIDLTSYADRFDVGILGQTNERTARSRNPSMTTRILQRQLKTIQFLSNRT